MPVHRVSTLEGVCERQIEVIESSGERIVAAVYAGVGSMFVFTDTKPKRGAQAKETRNLRAAS